MQKNNLKMEKCVVSKPYNPEEKCEQLVENIKLLCKERAISYYALAQKADISTSALHSMMTGKTKPYMYTVYKLCNALEIPISELLIDEECEEQEVLTFDELQMLAVYRQLSVGEKDLIHDVVKLLQGYEVKRK
ncbi:helix-turn-helix domain-containing protein [Blautia acetigignens]|uniref:helix-turn-helix domain-containing protein n=1 Tax=Blautia acetigignens TaxID=2981783 RepID=UPI0018A0DE22|nr:helix-turn-helix transcriptional regulator [Blautia acetigignens]MCU6776078.1 helix-turn-helix domain-containing protein [Blautia acetigignens]